MADSLEAVSSNVEDLVWHYTTSAGLLGIINDGVIWASCINYLNDANENLVVKQMLRKSIEKHRNSPELGSRFNRTRADLQALGKSTHGLTLEKYHRVLQDIVNSASWSDSEDNIFVTCFSGKRDSLSQWRAYTAAGGSHALAFEKRDLNKLYAFPAAKEGHDFIRRRFGQVEYYSKERHDIVFEEVANTIIVQTVVDISGLDQIVKLFSSESTFFKDSAFEEEHEWRLVCSGNIDYIGVRFRPARSHLVPYITVPLEDVPIKEIIVGPGPSRDLDERALRNLIDARHYDFRVTRSDVPFRNW